MSQTAYLTVLTIQVISDTPLTPSTIQEILMGLDRLTPPQMDGQTSSVSYSCMPIAVLH